MILNLGTIMSAATNFAGGRLDYSVSEASMYVNWAYAEVATRINYHRGKQAIAVSSTTSGGNRIALPTDFDYATALTAYIGSGSTQSSCGTTVIPLRQRDARWIDSQTVEGDTGTTNSTPGIPDAYVIYSSWLELWPSPNSAYSMQLRYITKAPVLVNSTDTPVIDERWHTAILYKTIELLEGSRNNVEGELLARNRYLNYVSSTPTSCDMKRP